MLTLHTAMMAGPAVDLVFRTHRDGRLLDTGTDWYAHGPRTAVSAVPIADKTSSTPDYPLSKE